MRYGIREFERIDRLLRRNEERRRPKPWFAWFPITLEDGTGCWLEVVMKRRDRDDWRWIYEARV